MAKPLRIPFQPDGGGPYGDGVRAFNRGDLARAQEAFALAVAEEPRYADRRYALGRTLAELGDWGEATVQLRTALQINSRYVEALRELALVLVEQGRYDEGTTFYRQAQALLQGQGDATERITATAAAFFERGLATHRQGHRDEATRFLRAAADLDPRGEDLRFNLAVEYLEADRLAEARDELEALITDNPRFVEGYHILAHMARIQQQPLEAISVYWRALEAGLDFPDLRLHLGRVMLEVGDIPGAVQETGTAICQAPHFALAYQQLGQAYAACACWDSAATAYERYLQLRPREGRVILALGQAAQSAQDPDRAREAYEQARNIPAVREEASQLLQQLLADRHGAAGAPGPAARAGVS